jgi:hypothetical protein
MPKYQLVKSDRIIGYDDSDRSVIVYKPQKSSLAALPEEDIAELMVIIREHPEGGNMTEDEIRALKDK